MLGTFSLHMQCSSNPCTPKQKKNISRGERSVCCTVLQVQPNKTRLTFDLSFIDEDKLREREKRKYDNPGGGGGWDLD